MSRSALPLAIMLILAGCGGPKGDGKSTLWAGNLQLCRDTVKSVSYVAQKQTGEPSLWIELNAKAAVKFSRMTARLEGKVLQVTLDGEVISEPNIAERVRGGAFELSPPQSKVEPARIEAGEACQ